MGTAKHFCESGMFIPDHGSKFFSILHPGSRNSNKRGGGKNLLSSKFFFVTNLTKLKCIHFWKGAEKKIWANWRRTLILFSQKWMVTKLSKNMGWGSGIQKKPYSGPRIQGRGQKGTGSRILNCYTAQKNVQMTEKKWWWVSQQEFRARM